MATEAELEVRARRRSWWLLTARLSAGRTQGDLAQAIGLTSASSYGDFERNVTAPSMRQLALLAVELDVPLSLLTEPAETDEERLEERTGRDSRRTGVADDRAGQQRAMGQ